MSPAAVVVGVRRYRPVISSDQTLRVLSRAPRRVHVILLGPSRERGLEITADLRIGRLQIWGVPRHRPVPDVDQLLLIGLLQRHLVRCHLIEQCLPIDPERPHVRRWAVRGLYRSRYTCRPQEPVPAVAPLLPRGLGLAPSAGTRGCQAPPRRRALPPQALAASVSVSRRCGPLAASALRFLWAVSYVHRSESHSFSDLSSPSRGTFSARPTSAISARSARPS